MKQEVQAWHPNILFFYTVHAGNTPQPCPKTKTPPDRHGGRGQVADATYSERRRVNVLCSWAQ